MTVDVLQQTEYMTGFIIERSSKKMKQSFQQVLKDHDFNITVDQWVVLQELNQSNGQGQIELASKTFKDAPTITRIIDILCKKAYVERIPNPTDRRRFKICLTKHGEQLVSQVMPHVHAFRQKAYAGLNHKQLEQLKTALNHIFENLNTI